MSINRTDRMSGVLAAAMGMVMCLMLATTVSAQVDNTWLGGTGYWTNGVNWSTGVKPGSSALTNFFIDGGNSLVSTVKVVGVVSYNATLGSLTISSGDVLQLMNATAGSLRPTAMTNEGLIQVISGSGFYFQTPTLRNSGIMEAVGGELLYSPASSGTINNTDGVIRATSGSFLVNKTGTKIVGGNLYIASAATNNIIPAASAQCDLVLDGGVIATNAGYTVIKTTTLPGGSRNTFLTVTNGAKYVNTGTLDIIQNLTNAMDGNVNMRFRVEAGGELKNTGTINISQVQTNNAGAWAIPAYLQMNVEGFQNDGTITINSLMNSTDTAQFRSTFAITNAGNIVVQGPMSSILMTNQALIQTAGTLTVKDGGSIVVSNLTINGGTLTGDGSVTGAVVVSAASILAPGTNSVGMLSITGGVTFAENAVYNWDYGNATGDLVKVTGNLTLPASAIVNVTGSVGFPATATLFTATTLDGAPTLNWTVNGVSGYSAKIQDNSVVLYRSLTSSGLVIIIE